MALILEVLHGGRHVEVRERHRLGDAALTIGRGLDNGVVLDDPHVDAHHARLERDAAGGWLLRDLGSVNRLSAGLAVTDAVAIEPGVQVTIGRTTIRFRDDAVSVPPAIPLRASVPVGERPWYERTGGRLGLVGAVLLMTALDGWLGSVERGAGSEAFQGVIFVLAFLAIWAGVWSVAARAVLGHFQFLAHAAIGACAVLVVTVSSAVLEWMTFLYPAMSFGSIAQSAIYVALLVALIAGHLGAASHLSRQQRWRAGAIGGTVVLALMGISAALEEEEFTAEAVFAGGIKTLTTSLVPQQSESEFAETRAALRTQVDELLTER